MFSNAQVRVLAELDFDLQSQIESVLTVSSLPPSPLDDLKRYKLVRILDRTVYVVMNLSDKSGSRCYAMKVSK